MHVESRELCPPLWRPKVPQGLSRVHAVAARVPLAPTMQGFLSTQKKTICQTRLQGKARVLTYTKKDPMLAKTVSVK